MDSSLDTSIGGYTAMKQGTMGTMIGLYSLEHITATIFLYSRVRIGGGRKNGRRRRVRGVVCGTFPKGEYHNNKKLNIYLYL